MSNATLVFDVDLALSVSAARARRDHRKALTGINIKVDNGKVIYAATDGKQMLRTARDFKPEDAEECEGDSVEELIIDYDELKSIDCLSKTVFGQGVMRLVTVRKHNGLFKCVFQGLSIEIRGVLGRYPKCEEVIPDESTGEYVAYFCPRVLMKALKSVAPMVGKLEGVAITFRSDGRQSISRVNKEGESDFIGVVMGLKFPNTPASRAGNLKKPVIEKN